MKFIHTGDWHLGLTRRFLTRDAQARFTQARFNAVRAIGRLARDEGAAFVAAAGDLFESNQAAPGTVLRALEALRDVPVPVLLLPGNHDPLNEASIYRTRLFLDNRPSHVRVLRDGEPVGMDGGVEVVGAPWRSKNLLHNPALQALELPAPAVGVRRILLAHGPVNTLPPFDGAAAIPVDRLERALHAGRLHFAALGDRHSLTRIGDSGRVWYAGTPEPTDFRETDAGCVNLVELDGDVVRTRAERIGVWSFADLDTIDLSCADDVEALASRLAAMADKEQTIVRFALAGSLGVAEDERLRALLGRMRELFAALDVRDDDLMPAVDDDALIPAHLSGFAMAAAETLRERMAAGGEDGRTARDALLLLLRLAPPPEEGDGRT